MASGRVPSSTAIGADGVVSMARKDTAGACCPPAGGPRIGRVNAGPRNR